LFSGNTKTIANRPADGNHAGNVIKPSAKIPFSLNVQYSITKNEIVTNIPATGISPVYDTETDDFELMLNYYRGEVLNYSGLGTFSLLEPTMGSNRDFGLTVQEQHSIGQTYIKPYISMLGDYEPITAQFLFPPHIFLEVIKLFSPQEVPPASQTRWVMLHHTRMLPTQMNFEFSKGKKYIKCEMKLAKISVLL
jgi:hypothetical protein